MFKPNQKVIWLITDVDPRKSQIASGIVKTSGKYETYIQGQEYPYMSAFLYPDTPECQKHLQAGMDMNKRHKEEENEYMCKTYQLNNQLVRDGFK